MTAENRCKTQMDRSISIKSESSAEKWVIQVKDELKTLTETCSTEPAWNKQSVYRVPSSMKDLFKDAYTPDTVSIGPYHHGDGRLKGMEEHKHRALHHFLGRSKKPPECYLRALAQVVDDLMDAYDQLDDKCKQGTEAFLKLMIVDGCFILELMRTTTPEEKELKQMDYSATDPVFSNHGKLHIVPFLKRDMLMLENQLPMLVLTTLLAIEKSGRPTEDNLSHVQDDITVLILKFFGQPYDNTSKINKLRSCRHILDVYRKSLLWNPNEQTNEQSKGGCDIIYSLRDRRSPRQQSQPTGSEIIRSTSELYEAGITIRPSDTKSLQDISFHGNVLKLPRVVVDDTSQSMYLNLMAFERLHVGAGNEVTSYVFFMDNIIDSDRDVSLLHSFKIIQNALGSDKAIADLFNTISKDITLEPNSKLDNVHKQVSEYCERRCHRWMAGFCHTYCTNPWAVISVIAAIILFVLTGLQTYYTIVAYHTHE